MSNEHKEEQTNPTSTNSDYFNLYFCRKCSRSIGILLNDIHFGNYNPDSHLVSKMADTEDYSYFFGKIPRTEADHMLTGAPDGSFLLRVSTSSAGDYVLSVSYNGGAFHFQIKSQGEVCCFKKVYDIGDFSFVLFHVDSNLRPPP